MQHVDERILEYLDACGWLSPRQFSREPGIEVSERRIRERCIVLCHVGFAAPMYGDELAEVNDGIVITRLGLEYLRGELDARLHRPPPRARRDIGCGHPGMV
jgi:hypothetical protein